MKTFYNVLGMFILLLVLLATPSCKKENNNAPQYTIPGNLLKISSGYAPGAAMKIEVYATDSLFVGYNNLSIALYDSVSNQRITQAQLTLLPGLNSGKGPAGSFPVQNPANANAASGLFSAAVVFVSSTSEAANWTLSVQVVNPANSSIGDFTSIVTVTQPLPARAYSLTALDDGSNLFVALVQPGNAQIGVNNFEMVICKQLSMANYAFDNNYTVAVNAEMPSMAGMNSPNNVNPSNLGNGYYQGKIDFIMYGGWQVYINLMHNGAVSDSTHYFDFSI